MVEPPRPLHGLVEDPAALMRLGDAGLELVVQHGRLVKLFTHTEKQKPSALGAYDEPQGQTPAP